MKNKPIYTLLLSLLPGVGPSRYWSYIDQFDSAEAALLSPPDQLPKLSNEAKYLLNEFQQEGEMSPLACEGFRILEIAEQQGARILAHQHPEYPGLLKQIYRPPPLLYVKGNTELLSLPQIALVGTRHPTQSGIDNTKAFARYLAAGGFTITSGLALGIDGIAHEATLKAKGTTVAVMATGIDRVYPKRHQRLADAIVDQGGLLVTEFPPGTEPRAANFPRRNRIISGLSLGVLVMEAAIQSGSLITARYALEQNREIFAVPGSIHNPQAKGCHALIKEGAQLVETGEDIIKQLAGIIRHFASQQLSIPAAKQANEIPPASTTSMPKSSPTSSPPAAYETLDDNEQKILRSIGYDTVALEQLIERTGLTSAEVAAILLNLEIKGVVKHSDWGYEVVHEAV